MVFGVNDVESREFRYTLLLLNLGKKFGTLYNLGTNQISEPVDTPLITEENVVLIGGAAVTVVARGVSHSVISHVSIDFFVFVTNVERSCVI